MKHYKRLATGLITLFAAWLCMGQAALVYAAPADPSATTTITTPSPDPSAAATATPSSTDPGASTTTSLPGGGDGSNPSDYIKPSCSGGGLGWIVCPLINVGVATIAKISKLVVDMLQTKPLTQDSGLFNAWKAFRDLANVMFILIFMFLIFGNLMGSEGSPYQIKSLLPKLVIAAITVQFSFFITAMIIDIGNVSGAGVGAIFSQLGATAGNANDISHGIVNVGSFVAIGLAALTAVIATVILTWPIILLMLGGFLVSILGVFFTLALRQLIIALLIVLSPLAFAAAVLPNTEEYFKAWYKNLIRVILIYPLIVVLLAIGGFVARIASESDGIFGSHEINVIFASIIPIIVFFAIPATFKAATGIMARASNSVFNRHDRIKGQLGGSQLRKDLKESRQERGFINQRDIRGTTFGAKRKRGIARLQAGQLGFGQPGKRRLAKGYETAMATNMKDWGTIFDDQKMGNAALYSQVFEPGVGGKFQYVRPDGTIKNVHITKAMQAQSIAQMAKQGGWLELNNVLDKIFDPTLNDGKGAFISYQNLSADEVEDMWYRGLGNSGVMPQAIQTIPQINPGKRDRAYDGLNPSQVTNIHGTGASKYYNRIMRNIGPDDNLADVATGQRERVAAAFRNFVNIAGSPQQRATVDPALLKYFKQKLGTDANFHHLMSQQKTKFNRQEINGVEFFNKYVSDSGRIEPEGIVP